MQQDAGLTQPVLNDSNGLIKDYDSDMIDENSAFGHNDGTAVPSMPVPASKKKLQLTDLSTELLHCILDHVSSPICFRDSLLTFLELPYDGWLASLLRVSKQLYDLALPRLYHRIEWTTYATKDEESTFLDPKILQLLDPNNRGLNHVRALILDDAHEYTRSMEKVHEYPEAALFAHLLPKNILTTFQSVYL